MVKEILSEKQISDLQEQLQRLEDAIQDEYLHLGKVIAQLSESANQRINTLADEVIRTKRKLHQADTTLFKAKTPK